MITLVAGALLLLIGLYGLSVWIKADPKALVAAMMRTLAYAALLGAAGALVTGRIGLALPLGAAGLALLGRLDPAGVGGYLGGLFRRKPVPQTSGVRTSLIEMELDHSTGEMRGTILAGPHAGRHLEDLDVPALVALRPQCDAQSLALLEAYLDRRAPAWREDVQGNAGTGNMGGGSGLDAAMPEEEAYQILGLQPGADAEAVRSAHRSLMKKLHPDHGGSDYLAARINRAKDVILRKHR